MGGAAFTAHMLKQLWVLERVWGSGNMPPRSAVPPAGKPHLRCLVCSFCVCACTQVNCNGQQTRCSCPGDEGSVVRRTHGTGGQGRDCTVAVYRGPTDGRAVAVHCRPPPTDRQARNQLRPNLRCGNQMQCPAMKWGSTAKGRNSNLLPPLIQLQHVIFVQLRLRPNVLWMPHLQLITEGFEVQLQLLQLLGIGFQCPGVYSAWCLSCGVPGVRASQSL